MASVLKRLIQAIRRGKFAANDKVWVYVENPTRSASRFCDLLIREEQETGRVHLGVQYQFFNENGSDLPTRCSAPNHMYFSSTLDEKLISDVLIPLACTQTKQHYIGTKKDAHPVWITISSINSRERSRNPSK
jgi:hypothetical protein